MAMFEVAPSAGRKRWSGSMLLSFGLQLALLALVLWPKTAEFVTPHDVQLGIPHSLGSQSIVYLAPVGPEQTRSSQDQPKLPVRAKLTHKPAPPKPEPKRQEDPAETAPNAPEVTARGGSPFGRLPGSPLTGDDVRPAFPDVYPDPPVSRADIPNGVVGDVIVEVTIDPQGNVTQTRLLQGIGYGVEEKVLDVLQRWHFHPAQRFGMNIASQHIVHFHYPA
jgi:TonB family protein